MKLICAVAMLFLTSAAAAAQPPAAPTAPPTLTDQEMERFLLEAKVVGSHPAGKGVTGSERATLRQGSFTHDAHVQTIDEQTLQGPGPHGSVEFRFRDSWTYNVAAYRLDRLLGLNLVPVSVERQWHGRSAAYTWWVDDVLMDEQQRLDRKVVPLSILNWNREMLLLRVFDQLIYNVDRNVGNVLITKTWRMWAIDHTRAFRTYHQLKAPKDVTACDRTLLERLRQLDKKTLKQELGRYLTGYEIDALIARRDAIVAIIDKLGPVALFDRAAKPPGGSKP